MSLALHSVSLTFDWTILYVVFQQCDEMKAERRIQYCKYGIPMYQAALKGDWEPMRHILDRFPEGITAGITKQGDTALHIAALSRCAKFVQQLVILIHPNNLRIQNRTGNTALCLAAASGTVPIARVLMEKNRELPTSGAMLS